MLLVFFLHQNERPSTPINLLQKTVTLWKGGICREDLSCVLMIGLHVPWEPLTNEGTWTSTHKMQPIKEALVYFLGPFKHNHVCKVIQQHFFIEISLFLLVKSFTLRRPFNAQFWKLFLMVPSAHPKHMAKNMFTPQGCASYSLALVCICVLKTVLILHPNTCFSSIKRVADIIKIILLHWQRLAFIKHLSLCFKRFS